MPRQVSFPFQNFGSRLALVVRPTPNAVKFINIWLDLQLPGRRSNPWAKFLGMPVPCLCLGLSYSNFRNLAQGLHNWWDPLQMRCHFSKHTIWASLLVSGRRSNPWAKLLEMPVLCLCTGVKQCIFHWLVSNDIAQKEMVWNSLIIYHFIMITHTSYEITFTVSLPKLINIALL